MTKDGQNEYLENSESAVIHTPTNGSSEATSGNRGSSSSVDRKSTGPRTAQGKERSKHNALRHGIFAKVVVLPGESQREFDALLNGLRNDFQPVGTFESCLIETLAITWSRQRRLLIAEGAEIRIGTEFFEWDKEQRRRREVSTLVFESKRSLMEDRANPASLKRCSNLLRELRERIEQNGFDPVNDLRILTELYGARERLYWEWTLLEFYRECSRIANIPDHAREPGESHTPEECKQQFLKSLARQTNRLKSYQKEHALNESERMRLELLRWSVPDSPRLDALLRYATSLERTFERTLNQLERAQRMRLGQPVAPPISLNVSSS